jgi:hypothetical protein
MLSQDTPTNTQCSHAMNSPTWIFFTDGSLGTCKCDSFLGSLDGYHFVRHVSFLGVSGLANFVMTLVAWSCLLCDVTFRHVRFLILNKDVAFVLSEGVWCEIYCVCTNDTTQSAISNDTVLSACFVGSHGCLVYFQIHLALHRPMKRNETKRTIMKRHSNLERITRR